MIFKHKIFSYLFLIASVAISLASCKEFVRVFEEGQVLRVQILNDTHVSFNVVMKTKQYFSIGFGVSMKNVDMIIWHANGAKSYAIDYHSIQYINPVVDDQQDLTTTFRYNQTHVNFTSTRLMETGDFYDYPVTDNFEMPMIYAYVKFTQKLVYHLINQRGYFYMTLDLPPVLESNNSSPNSTDKTPVVTNDTESIDDGGLSDGLIQVDIISIHGWVMWVTWGLMGFLQIATTRYLKLFFKINMWIHIFNGCLMTFITIIMCLLAFQYYSWKVLDSVHSIIGFIVLLSVGVISILGFIVYGFNQKLEWKTHRILLMKQIHSICGYALILLSQIAIVFGIIDYDENFGVHNDEYDLVIAHISCFFIVWAMIELLYQIQLRRRYTYKQCNFVMTLQEFNYRISKGEKLVILDDMVLDVSDYMFNHPGGTFVIEHSIGADISKFFYGGYQLENESYSFHKSTLHNHSGVALQIISQLIVAKLEKPAIAFQATIKCKEQTTRQTYCVTFQLEKNSSDIKDYYKDLNMIGKHYLISNTTDKYKKRRHYTICSCLQPGIYPEYMRALQQFHDKADSMSTINLEMKDVDNKLNIIIKNYKVKDGLSKNIVENANDDKYLIQGPMGKGLDIQPNGVHIAFAAGTGVLVFLDIVAYMIRMNLGMIPVRDSQLQADKFKFVLYASFNKEKDIIGHELCLGLKKISETLKLDNFEYYVRLTEKPNSYQKWDEQFIDDTLSMYDGNIQKIWVCGPPLMNEDFDKALHSLQDKYEINPFGIEIL